MPRPRKTDGGRSKSSRKPIEQYEHTHETRLNNPPVGLVKPETELEESKKKYEYDPHLDPQLVWAGKAEHTSFEVPTVSLHVHERIDPKTVLEAVRPLREARISTSTRTAGATGWWPATRCW